VQLAGDSAIEFTGGQITSLAASAQLDLAGNDAFIEDSTALGSNSALTGLASIGAGASFELADGASVSTTGALLNDGTISLDANAGDAGGSSLTVAGALTNSGSLSIGNTRLSASDAVTAKSFVNSGEVVLLSDGALNVSGATTNNGSISIADDTETLAGAVGGAGSIALFHANLRFDSSVSAGQTIGLLPQPFAVNELTLKKAQSLAATISGFGAADRIDAANFLFSGTNFNFAENSANTGGTLTLHDGSLTANILMTGSYSNSDFALAPDGRAGTLVNFV
jgi:hypothetical protein